MRNKHKRPLAIALIVLSVNVIVVIYDQYVTRTPGDILRHPAVIDHLGPALPPDDLEDQLTRQNKNHRTTLSNATANGTRSQNQIQGLRTTKSADKFLIHSYRRSGASKVAEALNLHHAELFYFHHPLVTFDDDNPMSGTNVLNAKRSNDGMGWLKDIYNCSFHKRDRFLSEPSLWKSHSIRNTYRLQCKNLQLTDCLEKSCKQRPLRAVFTLRLGINYIYKLIKFYGDKLKVVVMLRDPRVILANRRRDHIGHTLKSLEDFKKQVLRYEHLVLNPAAVLTYLYEFLGLEVSSTRFLDISDILRLQIPEEQRLQLTKSWQLELTLQESRAVDKGCQHQYKNLGYFPVPKNINAYNKYFIDWDQLMYGKDPEIVL